MSFSFRTLALLAAQVPAAVKQETNAIRERDKGWNQEGIHEPALAAIEVAAEKFAAPVQGDLEVNVEASGHSYQNDKGQILADFTLKCATVVNPGAPEPAPDPAPAG